MSDMVQKRTQGLLAFVFAVVFLATAGTVSFLQSAVDILYRPNYEELFLKAVADEHLSVGKKPAAVSKVSAGNFSVLCNEASEKIQREEVNPFPVLFAVFTEFQWAPDTHEVCVVRYIQLETGGQPAKGSQRGEVRKLDSSQFLAVYGSLPRKEVFPVHGVRIDMRPIKLERFHLRSEADPDLKKFYGKAGYVRVISSFSFNENVTIFDKLLISKLRLWTLGEALFRVKLVAGLLTLLGLLATFFSYLQLRQGYTAFFVRVADGCEGGLNRSPELERSIPGVFSYLFRWNLPKLAERANQNLRRRIKSEQQRREQALANRPRRQADLPTPPKCPTLQEKVDEVGAECERLLGQLPEMVDFRTDLSVIATEEDLAIRLHALKSLRKRLRRSVYVAREPLGRLELGGGSNSAADEGKEDVDGIDDSSVEYITLVSRIKEVCPVQRIAGLVPASLNPQAVRAILFALLKPGSRDRTFGERYRKGDSLRRMTSNLYIRLTQGKALRTTDYDEALSWLVRQRVVRAYKLDTTFSLEPRLGQGASQNAQMLIRMMLDCERRFHET